VWFRLADLTVITSKSLRASTFVYAATFPAVQARNYAFRIFAVGTVVTFRAFASVFLHAFSTVQAFLTANTSFAMPPLKPWRAAANSRRSTVTSIHTLRITQGSLAVLPHVAFRALTYFFVITPSLIGAFFIAFGVRIYNIM
jgi:hypothetical protein